MAEPVDRDYRDNPEVAHEASDVSVSGILRFALLLTIVAVTVHVALYGLLRYYEHREARQTPSFAPPRQEEPPPEPRLRVAPRGDLIEMRKAEEQLLQSYGWIDRDKNLARVPIERGMEAVLKRGLPVRKSAPQPPSQAAESPKRKSAEESR